MTKAQEVLEALTPITFATIAVGDKVIYRNDANTMDMEGEVIAFGPDYGAGNIFNRGFLEIQQRGFNGRRFFYQHELSRLTRVFE